MPSTTDSQHLISLHAPDGQPIKTWVITAKTADRAMNLLAGRPLAACACCANLDGGVPFTAHYLSTGGYWYSVGAS
jgi:hypothetical protein